MSVKITTRLGYLAARERRVPVQPVRVSARVEHAERHERHEHEQAADDDVEGAHDRPQARPVLADAAALQLLRLWKVRVSFNPSHPYFIFLSARIRVFE